MSKDKINRRALGAALISLAVLAVALAAVRLLGQNDAGEASAELVDVSELETLPAEDAGADIGSAEPPPGEASAESPVEPAYVSELFGDELIVINILADKDEWAEMMKNATDEQYIHVDVVVNGTLVQNVALRPKGNSSLQSSAQNSDGRVSFKMKFDGFERGQTCFGLDLLILNNMFTDATLMKDYLAFDMMNAMGVDGSLSNFAVLYVNGEYWALYTALEGYDRSFCHRVYGLDRGNLYNVKSARMDMDSGDSKGGGSDLVYVGDDTADYPDIFSNSCFSRSDEDDFARVVASIRALNEGTELETCLDVDQILRYLAVHTFLLNSDSYYSSSAQNYYVYEYGGKMSILPWDYNMCLSNSMGGSSDMTELLNSPIDTPLSGSAEMDERPLLGTMLANETYRARYHAYLRELCEGYLTEFSDVVTAAEAKIDPWAETDPRAFTAYADYKQAISSLCDFVELRRQSILGQLDGLIPSTTDGQSANSAALLDGSALDDSFAAANMPGGGPGGGRGFPASGEASDASGEASPEAAADSGGDAAS